MLTEQILQSFGFSFVFFPSSVSYFHTYEHANATGKFRKSVTKATD